MHEHVALSACESLSGALLASEMSSDFISLEKGRRLFAACSSEAWEMSSSDFGFSFSNLQN